METTVIRVHSLVGPRTAQLCHERVSHAGWKGFWKGNALNVVRTAPFKAVNYFTFDTLLRYFIDNTGGMRHGYERFLAGAGAGIFATLTCFPLDVLRTRMMSPSHPTGVFQTLREMIALEGIGSFYTGCFPAIVSMAIGGAVFYGTYDWLKTARLVRLGKDPCALSFSLWSPQYLVLFGCALTMPAEHDRLCGIHPQLCDDCSRGAPPADACRRTQGSDDNGTGVLRQSAVLLVD
jgi:hypothetical protein